MGRRAGLLLIATFALFAAAAAPAVAAQQISVGPDRAFGNVLVGTTSTPLALTISNTGNADLQMNGIVLSGTGASDFAISTDNCAPYPRTIGPSGSCTVQVQFAPTSRGSKMIVATVSSDDSGGGDSTASLSGTGVAPVVAFTPTSVHFGAQPLGSASNAQSVAISNNGDALLSISSVVTTGTDAADFTIENDTCGPYPKNLAAGGSCTLDVRFTPGSAGARAAGLRVTSNSPPDGIDDLDLDGSGTTAPGMSLAPGSLSFGDQAVDTGSSTRTATITSDGTGSLTVDSIAVSGPQSADFSIVSNTCPPLPTVLPPSESCTVGIRFTPAATGARAASLHVSSDAGGEDVHLSGNGTAATVSEPVSTPSGGGTPPTTESNPLAPTAPTVVQTPAAPGCFVPNLKGKTLAAARRALRKAHCRLGKVRRTRSHARPGRVIRQRPKPGKKLPAGARVGVVLARRQAGQTRM